MKKYGAHPFRGLKTFYRPIFRHPFYFYLIIFALFMNDASCRNPSAADPFGAKSPSPLKNTKANIDAWNVQKAFREIYKTYKNKVVYISTEQTINVQVHPFFQDPAFREFFGIPRTPFPRKQKQTGLGTGFVLSKDGYICTNHHVVANVDKISVKINGKSYDAKLIGSDKQTDIALLKIEPNDPLEPVYMGNSDTVKVGDWAIAIGNPFGLDRTFTVGVVSATGRKDLDFMGGRQTHIQTDASINPGNSGGPLINIDGEVIGINRMIYSKSGGNLGIGFAIPINTAIKVLSDLKIHKKVKRAYIGVQIVPLTEEYAKQLGLESNDGALVGRVLEGSPADKGGLAVGDVILAVDGKHIKNFTDLVDIVENTKIGKTLKITVWRNRSKVHFFVTVKERP